MDKNPPGLMTPFDELITSPELQIMKLLIPYAPASGRRMLAACVKVMELKETLRIFNRGYGGIQAQMLGDDRASSLFDILNSFRPYLKPDQAAVLDMVINIREMMSVMEMMQSTSSSESGSASIDPMTLLSGMLSPEQQEMFQMYSDLFSQTADNPHTENMANAQGRNADSDWKGDDTDGRMDEQPGDEEYRSREAGTDPHGSGTDLG